MKGEAVEEERRKILEMVESGKITAEDGARLLSALEEGGAKKAAGRPGGEGRRGHRQPRGFDAVAQALSGIGPAVKNAVQSAMSTIDIDPGDSFDTDVYEELDVIDHTAGPIDIGGETRIVFRTRKSTGGDLSLRGRDDSAMELSGETESLKVMGGDDMVVVVWGDGLLTAGVPESARVEVRTTGGDVEASGLHRDLKVKTLGGGITLREVSGAVAAKTMGGSIVLDASGPLSGGCVAKTLGGDISVTLPAGAVSNLSAKTMGGEVDIDESLGETDVKGGPGSARGSLSFPGGADASLSLKTLGGNVSVGRREDG
jgi:hypothetical protein